MSCACHASFFEPKPCVLCPLETGMSSPVFIAFIAIDVMVHLMSWLSDSSGQRIGEVLPLKGTKRGEAAAAEIFSPPAFGKSGSSFYG